MALRVVQWSTANAHGEHTVKGVDSVRTYRDQTGRVAIRPMSRNGNQSESF